MSNYITTHTSFTIFQVVNKIHIGSLFIFPFICPFLRELNLRKELSDSICIKIATTESSVCCNNYNHMYCTLVYTLYVHEQHM